MKGQIERLDVNLQLVITSEDIDDIMACALEGGIDYWCSKVRVDGEYKGEYASEQISGGGRLWLHDRVEKQEWLLTKEKLIQGIRMYIEQPRHAKILEVINHELRIDCCAIDAEVADCIVQYALFSDIMYG